MADAGQTGTLDDFTQRYLYLLAGAAVIGLAWWLLSLDFRASQLNDLLEADADLAAYPYQFRVLALDNGVARMSSPRSAQMSALQGLRVMYPELRDLAIDSPRLMEAQERLAQVQSRAAALVKEQEDVDRVEWVLDERWLASHGIYLQ
ncbi:MAG: hypothetical protein R3E54_12060 [Halioglobus sp.]